MYNKLFTKILDSSIWLESDGTRIVWLTLLAAMDQDGFAQFASVANLAHRARVSLDVAADAVRVLEQPDPHSSDPDNDGVRVERAPGGWIILNAGKYQELATRRHQREQTRERVQRHRSRPPVTVSNAPVTVCNAGRADVTVGNESVTPSDTDTHTDPDTDTRASRGARVPAKSSGRQTGRLFLHRWQLDALIDTLGPHAADFGLDEWLDALSNRPGVLPADRWAWVQGELQAEVQRRGLPVASAPAAPTNKRIAGLIAGGEAFLRRQAERGQA